MIQEQLTFSYAMSSIALFLSVFRSATTAVSPFDPSSSMDPLVVLEELVATAAYFLITADLALL